MRDKIYPLKRMIINNLFVQNKLGRWEKSWEVLGGEGEGLGFKYLYTEKGRYVRCSSRRCRSSNVRSLWKTSLVRVTERKRWVMSVEKEVGSVLNFRKFKYFQVPRTLSAQSTTLIFKLEFPGKNKSNIMCCRSYGEPHCSEPFDPDCASILVIVVFFCQKKYWFNFTLKIYIIHTISLD